MFTVRSSAISSMRTSFELEVCIPPDMCNSEGELRFASLRNLVRWGHLELLAKHSLRNSDVSGQGYSLKVVEDSMRYDNDLCVGENVIISIFLREHRGSRLTFDATITTIRNSSLVQVAYSRYSMVCKRHKSMCRIQDSPFKALLA